MSDHNRRGFLTRLGTGAAALTGLAATTGTAAAAKFSGGQRVKTTADLSVRTGPAAYYDRVTVAPSGTAGYVRDGPETGYYGYTWYKIGYNTGYEGWSAANWLTEAPLAAFRIGERVHATTTLNVRSGGSLDDGVVGTVADETEGYVKNGYVTNDGYTWWEVAWDDGTRGWSVEKYIDSGPGNSADRQPQAITVDTPIDVRVDITGSELDNAIAGIKPSSPLIGLGDVWVDVQNQRSVDAIYQCAHACLESAYGTSDIAQDKNNLYGFKAYDVCPSECAGSFASYEQSIREVMEFVDTEYLSASGNYYVAPTLDGMNTNYATDDRWAEKIAGIYNRLVDNL